MKRIMIIGNGGGGKTTLARNLRDSTGLPLFHVDSIQYLPGWKVLDKESCDRQLAVLANLDTWIIDGFGSRDAIQHRLRLADTVIFVDHAIVVHYWWAMKRQLKSIRASRSELQAGCTEFSVYWTKHLFAVMWKVHREFRPWFLARLADLPREKRFVHIKSPRQLRSFLSNVMSERASFIEQRLPAN